MSWSYYPNYYSIDDIFVTQEKVPCIVEQDLAKIGFLDPSGSSLDLKKDQEVELPMWYVLQVQKDRGRNQFYRWETFIEFSEFNCILFCSVKIPNIYKQTYGEICKADATAVDLGRLNKYYYEFGRYVAHFDRNGFVARMIYEVILILWKKILLNFSNWVYLDVSSENEIPPGSQQQHQQWTAYRA